jgi:D-alanyl-D-alanine carboxypeptidase
MVAIGSWLILVTACADLVAPTHAAAAETCRKAMRYEGPPRYAQRIAAPISFVASSEALAPAVAQRLHDALTLAQEKTHAAHLGASVVTEHGAWHEDRASQGEPAPRYYWASAGKALTAVVIMQLVEEGKLRLDDDVSRWFPDVPNARAMTIDMLLQHTSGLFSANEDETLRQAHRYVDPDEFVRIASTHAPLFCPGQAWRYTNSGYVMLGRIIEALDARPYHEAVNARIASRLALTSLRSLAPRELPDDVAALAPSDGSVAMVEPSWPYAAGSVVASTDDMARFWIALLNGKMLSAKNTARLFENPFPMFDSGTFYGRGVMVYDLPAEQGRHVTWLGHSGGTPGAKAVVAYSIADQAVIAVALTGDGSAEATANLLLKALH